MAEFGFMAESSHSGMQIKNSIVICNRTLDLTLRSGVKFKCTPHTKGRRNSLSNNYNLDLRRRALLVIWLRILVCGPALKLVPIINVALAFTWLGKQRSCST